MAAQPRPDPSWVIGKHALLALRAAPRNGRTEIQLLARRTPYQWQGYHYQDHDDQPFVLLHNSGGGLVEGDVAELHIRAEANTRSLFTTTSATKFYKCEGGDVAHDMLDVEVHPDALFEYLPDEVIPYAGSRVMRRTRFLLAASSRLFASDVLSAGRINFADGEAFAFSSIRSELELWVGQDLVFLDRLIANAPDDVAELQRLWAGGRHVATILAYGDTLPDGCEAAVEAAGSSEGVRVGATRKGDLVCARIIADHAWQMHEAIQLIWATLRPSLADKPARAIAKS